MEARLTKEFRAKAKGDTVYALLSGGAAAEAALSGDGRWTVKRGAPVFTVDEGKFVVQHQVVVAGKDGKPLDVRKVEPVLAVGDVVMLKSGGMRMTVAAVHAVHVTCVWHDEDGRYQSQPYETALLHRVPGVHELDGKELADVARLLMEAR